MWENYRVAVYTGTRNLYPLMVPAVKSMICNSTVDEIWLFIEDDKFPEEYNMPKDIVKTRNVSKQTYFKPDGPNMKSNFTYMALMRAALYKEFPKLDRILALDVDTIVVKDISKLWDLPLYDKYYFAASMEPSASDMWTRKKGKKFLSTNVGVCLQNLNKFRDGKGDEIIEELNTVYWPFVDQEVFNEKCQGAIYEMPSIYNANDFTLACSQPCIAHFAGVKDWSDKPLIKEWTDIPWEQIFKYRKRVYGR